MEVTIRVIGNSKGIVLPKPLLAQVGLDDQSTADLTVEAGAIVLRKPPKPVRAGWAQAAHAVSETHQDTLVMGEFSNVEDSELSW